MAPLHDIADAEVYVSRLAKPLIDKMFFADKIDAEVIIDYGCGDGLLLRAMHTLFPEHTYIGYDKSEAMLERANGHAEAAVTYYHDWEHVQNQCSALQRRGQRICVVLSSIIHEVYSYANPQEIVEFWRRVFGQRFDYIAIRDMMVSATTSRPADPLSAARIRQVFDADRLVEWERQWGNLNENWSLVHFLLTYRYTENWQRELRENYLPQTVEAFLRRIPAQYRPIYYEHYIPPFLRRQVQNDFGITVPDPTHLKLIVELTLPP